MRYLKAVLIGVFMSLFVVGVAAATVDEVTPVGPDTVNVDTDLFNLPPYVVATFLGAIVPLIVGFLTKPSTLTWLKVAGNSVLSLLVGILTVSITDGGGAVVSWSTVAAAVVAWLSSGVSYGGAWKPLNITSNTGGALATVGVK